MVPHTTITYWTGPMPDVIRLCVESMRRTQPNFALVDDEALWSRHGGQWLVSALAPIRRDMLRTAQWADLVRLHLMAVAPASSTWLDADCIAREDIGAVRRLAETQADVIVYSNRTRAYPNPIIHCARPNAARALRDRALARCRALMQGGRSLPYTALGQDVLGDRTMQNVLKIVKLNRVPDVHPFVGHQGPMSSDKYSETDPALIRRWVHEHDWKVAHIVNRAIQRHKAMTTTQLTYGESMLCEMLRVSGVFREAQT